LSVHDWQRLETLLLAHVRRRTWALPELVDAILYVLKNGCLWRDVPGEFPLEHGVWVFRQM
jgi:transposase